MDEMDKELTEILDKQLQLLAMQESLKEFMDGLKKQQDEFLVKHLGYPKDTKNVSVFEMLKKVSDARKSKLIYG